MIITGPSLKLLSDTLLLHGGPVAIFPQDKSFHAFQQANDKVDDRVGQQKAQDVALGGS